jgi:hypothetical protein
VFDFAFLALASSLQAARFKVAAFGLSLSIALMLVNGFFLVVLLMVEEVLGALRIDWISSDWSIDWRSLFWITADGILQFFLAEEPAEKLP